MAAAKLEVLIKAVDQASREIKEVKKKLQGFEGQTKATTQKVTSLGKTLKKHWLAATAAIAGVALALRAVVGTMRAFADFEQGLTNIKILLGDNKDEIKLFEKEVNKLATTFGVATNDLLKSAFDIQSAVGNTAKSIDILNAATKLSVAGGADMVSTTKGLVTIMEAYGHELRDATDAADLLFLAQVRARATIAELAEASGSFLPIAANLGVRVEEVMAAFSQMTISIGNVSEASTAMTGVLNGLFKPTDELKAKFQEWYGTSVQAAIAQGKFLDAMKRLGQVEKEELGRLIPRIRGLKGLVAVSTEIAKVTEFASENMERQGQVAGALKDQMETAARQMLVFKQEVEELQRELGSLIISTGILRKLIDTIRDLKDDDVNRWQRMGRALNPFMIAAPFIERLTKEFEKRQAGGWEFGISRVKLAPIVVTPGEGIPGIPTEEDAAVADFVMSEIMSKFILKQAETLEKMKEMWLGYQDEKLSVALRVIQTQTEMWKVALTTQLKAHQSMWVAIGQMKDVFAKGMSSMFMDLIKGTKSVKESFKTLGLQMVQVLVDFLVQKGINALMSKLFQTAAVAAAKIAGAKIAAAMAPAATMMVAATAGGAAVAGGIALSSLAALAQSLALPKLAEGGIVNRPTMVLAGEKGPEAIVPLGSDRGFGFRDIVINIDANISDNIDIPILAEELGFHIEREIKRARTVG